MKKQLAAAACCLAVSVSPLLAGCSPNNETQQPEAPQSADANANSGADASKGAKPETNYKDGTYTGEGRGMGGAITVTLTVSDGKVTVDEITETGETAGIGGKEAIADGTFKAQIEEAQSADIDGVTGATMTTGGVISAVEEALAQAK